MGVLDIFKKEKDQQGKKKQTAASAKKQPIKSSVPAEEEKTSAPVAVSAVAENETSLLLCRPYLSEKSTALRDRENKYVFQVRPSAGKKEIKKLIERIYNVEVTKMNVINTPAKIKQWRRKESSFGRGKKIVVTVKEGQKIELGI